MDRVRPTERSEEPGPDMLTKPSPRPPHCQRCRSRLVRVAPRLAIRERLLGVLTVYPLCCQVCGYRTLAFWGRYAFVPQRAFSRIPVRYPAWFRLVEGPGPRTGHAGRLVDLSIGGCRLLGKTLPPLGARVTLDVELSGDAAPLGIEEALVCCHSGGGMGLAFTRIREAEQRRLGRLVQARLAATWPGPNRAIHLHA